MAGWASHPCCLTRPGSCCPQSPPPAPAGSGAPCLPARGLQGGSGVAVWDRLRTAAAGQPSARPCFPWRHPASWAIPLCRRQAPGATHLLRCRWSVGPPPPPRCLQGRPGKAGKRAATVGTCRLPAGRATPHLPSAPTCPLQPPQPAGKVFFRHQRRDVGACGQPREAVPQPASRFCGIKLGAAVAAAAPAPPWAALLPVPLEIQEATPYLQQTAARCGRTAAAHRGSPAGPALHNNAEARWRRWLSGSWAQGRGCGGLGAGLPAGSGFSGALVLLAPPASRDRVRALAHLQRETGAAAGGGRGGAACVAVSRAAPPCAHSKPWTASATWAATAAAASFAEAAAGAELPSRRLACVHQEAGCPALRLAAREQRSMVDGICSGGWCWVDEGGASLPYTFLLGRNLSFQSVADRRRHMAAH